jgi:hypothetical protein
MNLRHAAALALVGWYFMIPPPLPSPATGMDVHAPLSRWVRARSVDTADDCEVVRQGTLVEANKEVQKIQRQFAALPEGTQHDSRPLSEVAPDLYRADVQASRFAVAAASAQCIASDDPRLAK